MGEAAARAAELAALPEYFCLLGQRDSDKLAVREPFGERPDPGIPGPGRARVRALDRRRHAAAGRRGDAHVLNTSLVYSPTASGGAVRQDPSVQVRQRARTYDESRVIESGQRDRGLQLRFRDGHDWRVGLSVCYDLRFPELYRALGADVLLVPSAFTYGTGRRTGSCWCAPAPSRTWPCIAPAQGGVHENGRRTWGHHDGGPLGRCARPARRRTRRGARRLDPGARAQLRAQLPALEHRHEPVSGAGFLPSFRALRYLSNW